VQKHARYTILPPPRFVQRFAKEGIFAVERPVEKPSQTWLGQWQKCEVAFPFGRRDIEFVAADHGPEAVRVIGRNALYDVGGRQHWNGLAGLFHKCCNLGGRKDH
jgi:hypothetical protein